MDAVETVGLSKRFGAKVALDEMSLSVPSGSIFGFLGPNGAGKTTTLRVLLGLAHPTSGNARVLGEQPGRANHRVGYLPDVPAFYEWMTAKETLDLAGGLTRVPPRVLRIRIPELLSLVGLEGVTTKVGGYSRGMKQRLGIAQALVNDPEIVFLDEPTSALDPIGRKEVLECIAGLSGRTVVFSTHILADVERICDRLAILDNGRVVVNEGVSGLRERYGEHSMLVEVTDASALEAALTDTPWAKVAARDGGTLRITVTDTRAAERGLPRLCADLGLGLKRLEASEPTLEDIFVKLVGSESQ